MLFSKPARAIIFVTMAKSRLPRDIRELWSARAHSPAVSRERVNLIRARVRQIAGVFSVLTVIWIAIDTVTVSWPQWGELALGRVATALAFTWISLGRSRTWPTTSAMREVGSLIAVSLAFFLYANTVLVQNAETGSLAVGTAYYYLPFIIAAGLSIFPLTALESSLFALVCILSMTVAIIVWPGLLSGEAPLSTLWRLGLISGISILAGMSQLRFLLRLTEQAARDGLTGLLVRRVGEEILGNQFAYATRHNSPFSLIFIDLDHFKQLNDRFGHESGDTTLCSVASHLTQLLREQDIIIRWGGEEFVIALPNTDGSSAESTVRRLATSGIGMRPDGSPLTASIGIAERIRDAVGDPGALVDLADQRMYKAKRAGRNRYLGWEESEGWIPS